MGTADRILHVGGSMAIGGLERALFQLIRGQRNAGIRADLVVFGLPGFYAERTMETDAKVITLNRKHFLLGSYRREFRKLAKKYDIIHFHSSNPWLMAQIPRLSGPRICYTHRGGVIRYPLRRLLPWRISGFFIRRYCWISANTKHATLGASRLFKIPAGDIAVTYNGLDFSLLKTRHSKEDVLMELGHNGRHAIRIGTSARIRALKRIDLLLQAIAQLGDLSVHCFVIGDGSEREDLVRLSKTLKIGNRVTFTGMKENITDYLQILDVFVLPSDTSESFGNSAVEAMGLGIPTIVMRDGGGLVEHITDGGGFIAEDFEDLVQIIRSLVLSEELRTRVGQNGKGYVREKYTIEKMVEGYTRFYESTC